MRADYFAECYDEPAIKTRYRDLAREHHPDRGGSTETMQEINADYSARLRGEYRKTKSDDEADAAVESDERVAEILAKIITLPGIAIEICGRWLWITGDTYPVREQLKAAEMKWAAKKRAWYWHAPEDSCRGGKKSLEEIRAKYGSTGIQSRPHAQLAA